MRNRVAPRPTTLLLALGLIGLSALGEAAATPSIQRDARIVSIAAIYYAPKPSNDPLAAATKLFTQRRFFSVRSQRPASANSTSVFFEFADLKEVQFEPPGVDSLRYFGRGLTSEQAEALQRSTHGLILSFTYEGAQAFDAVQEISAVMHELAIATDGLIWDDDTRQLFGPDFWKKQRLEAWTDGLPRVENFTAIHAYKNTDYVRAISLGMSKFGLPDVVVNDFSWSLNDQMGLAINIINQQLVESAAIPASGPYQLRIEGVRHKEMREKLIGKLLDNATRSGWVTVKEAQRDDGDPDNRLLELTFDRYSGETVQERQELFADEMFGHHDEVTMVRHTDEVLAASDRARKKFETYRQRFEKGLEPGEHLLVKTPFATSRGTKEWMWVEVVKWQGGDITGLLRNDPDDVPGLHAGATVRVKQDEMFDYIRYMADGQQEGNETGPLLMRSAE